ncbi:decarboxylating 6-phosphogluconate dehydrogenase [Candidatus Daviesbacteria bacterium]|nr:decarboxylating 6-phosphogluconate dehydrogenase [Candidatus Daviesbacteria bacterium]
MKIGYIGLGKMGKNMVLHLLEQGIEVVAFNRSPEPVEEVVQAGAIKAENLEDLVVKLDPSATAQDDKNGKIIWLMLTAGDVTDEFVKKLSEILKPGDLIIDGGNSYYKDTLKRAELLTQKGIHFMDIGVSGGPKGARTGACLMIGGEVEDFEKIKDLVVAAAAPEAFAHLGPVGAGHFAKMVHNGIEYGMMEAIAEGVAILKNSEFNFDLKKVFEVYNHRSVIESRLVGWLLDALKEDPELSDTSPVIASTGEGEWTVKTAKEMGISSPVLEDSFKIRQNSSNDQENSPSGFRNKVVSAMRGQFGQHSVKKN